MLEGTFLIPKVRDQTSLVAVYVDDLLVTRSDLDVIHEFKQEMNANFGMTSAY